MWPWLMYNIEAVLNQTAVECKVFSRYRILLFWSFIFPLLFLAIFSYVPSTGGERYIDFSFSGIIMMALLTTCVTNTVSSIVSERTQRLYKRLQATPLKRSTLVFAKFIARYLVVLVQTILLFATARLILNVSVGGNIGLILLTITLAAMCFLSIAFLIAGVITDPSVANIVTMLLFFLLTFGSNSFFPISTYPVYVRSVVELLPSTHVSTAIRGIILYHQELRELLPHYVWLGAYSVLFTFLSIRFFRWDSPRY